MANVWEQLDAQEATAAAESAEHFARLVDRLAEGEDVPADEAGAILKRTGKTARELKGAVETRQERKRLTAIVAGADALKGDMKAASGRQQAELEAFTAAQTKLLTGHGLAVQGFEAETRQLQAKLNAVTEAERQLKATAPPELKVKRQELVNQRVEVARDRTRQQEATDANRAILAQDEAINLDGKGPKERAAVQERISNARVAIARQEERLQELDEKATSINGEIAKVKTQMVEV